MKECLFLIFPFHFLLLRHRYAWLLYYAAYLRQWETGTCSSNEQVIKTSICSGKKTIACINTIIVQLNHQKLYFLFVFLHRFHVVRSTVYSVLLSVQIIAFSFVALKIVVCFSFGSSEKFHLIFSLFSVFKISANSFV